MADQTQPPQSPAGVSTPVQAAKKANGKDALLRVKDPQEYEIKLDLETWEKHIVVGHPEMKNYLEKIGTTLAEPEVIIRSSAQDETHFYYRMSGKAFKRQDDLYLSVVVHRFEETKTGFVKTAHLVKKMQKGDLVWMKRNS
ncbi:MAG TPA: hypothetical protein VGR55_20510 [Candidatus Acidoferrum sp.]|nr:hypothetical protein [Candidatus Acidoferrum sp.]